MKLNLFLNKPSAKELAEYRKRIKIYDIFTFFNELELLEIRLNILAPFVDYFVIVESTETFSGMPKKLIFKENKERFKKFEKKIIHYAVKDTPADENNLHNRLSNDKLSDLDREIINNALTSDNVPKGIIHWLKEFYQKEMIKKALISLQDDDICFISDVDEIWNPEAQIDFTKDDIFKLKQNVYAYYVNNHSNEPWAGTLVTKYKNIKNGCLNHLRTASKTKYTYIKNGGWHFTSQGGADRIRQKLEASYGREDYNNDEIKSQIKTRMLANQDYIGRRFKFWQNEAGLPQFLLDNKGAYKHLFKNPPEAKKDASDLIVVKIQGGLGNQLFQYAIGRSLSIATGASVKYDVSWFSKQTKRNYELDRFNTQINIATPEEIKQFKKHQTKPGKLSFLNLFFPINESIYVQDQNLIFNPKALKIRAPAYLDGYWQSEKYFVNIEDILRKELIVQTPPDSSNQLLLDRIKSSTAISVHVRRGDYINNAKTNTFHGITPLDYYRRAIERMASLISNGTIFIFSDDHAWVKEHLQFDMPTIFVDCNDADRAYDDLRLMSSCQHHVIANSTFSWWGAWLNNNPRKIVIAPDRWFTNPTMSTDDLLPRNWIKL